MFVSGQQALQAEFKVAAGGLDEAIYRGGVARLQSNYNREHEYKAFTHRLVVWSRWLIDDKAN